MTLARKIAIVAWGVARFIAILVGAILLLDWILPDGFPEELSGAIVLAVWVLAWIRILMDTRARLLGRDGER